MKKVALLTLHGMGESKPDYHSELESGLKKRLGEAWAAVSFRPVHYADILQPPEDAFWRRAAAANRLDWQDLRKFVLFGFGDAGSLEHSAGRPPPTKYQAVQALIQDALRACHAELAGSQAKPVFIAAHSLGCQVISNYLWDAEKGRQIFAGTGGDTSPLMEFLRLKTLRNLTTFGCNIPLFVAGFDRPECFTQVPGSTWDNYYDQDDVLGWPLRQLGDTYGFINDHNVNAGGLLSWWNPLSHNGYWEDANILAPMADRLRAALA
jgi:hypothetical protein